MPNQEVNPIDAEKTALLVGVINLCLAPFYYLDSKLGIAASLAVTTGVLYKCNELGEARRPGAALQHNVHSALFPSVNADVTHVVKNIVNGGAHIVDEVSPGLKQRNC